MAVRPTARRRRVGVALVATGAALATTTLALLPSAGASSHREAPLILNEPAADNTDVYAFTSPDRPDTVTLIANWQPFEEPNGGPNFYPWLAGANHDINIDSDGDAEADLTYRWVFSTDDRRGKNTFLYNNGPVTSLNDENLLFRQTYDLQVLDRFGRVRRTLLDNAPVAPSNTGPAGMPDYAALQQQAVVKAGPVTSFAGQTEDPFFLDLRVFDLLYGGDLSETGQDTLAGYNVNTLAIQVPKSELALNGNAQRNPVIGVWSDTEKKSLLLSERGGREIGRQVQVSRLGNPLVNEVIVPAGLKDGFNGSEPEDDARNRELVARVNDPEVPRLLQAIYGLPAPATPRGDLFEVFLTGITNKTGELNAGDLNSQLINGDVNARKFQPSEQLRLNMSIPPTAQPNRLGVLAGDLQGFPNGRRLTDDVVDIEVQALAGALRTGPVAALAAGDRVDANDVAFRRSFPYVAVANNRSVTVAGQRDQGGAVPGVGPTGPGTPWLPGPLVPGLAAIAVLGAGVWMLRRTAPGTPAAVAAH